MPVEVLEGSAVEQAERVRSGEVSSRELVEASLEAIERLDPRLNAFVTMCGERALEEAEAVSGDDDRPLAGVPIGVKDLIGLTEGVRTTMGMAAMEDWVPAADSATIAKLRAAGAIVVGKTSTPEMGILPVTEPERFGPTRNPWDPDRTPGGSSGGSGAAVAAGMVPLAYGNDGGGSIRIPAACCGLVGLKPSRGRISLAPEFAEFSGGLVTEGVLSRTVLDTAVALDLMSAYEPGDPYWAAPPARPFAEAAAREPGQLRVAFTTVAPNRAPVDEEHVRATRETAELLESLGHHVEETEPEYAHEEFTDSFIKVWTAGVEDEIRSYGRLRGRELDRDMLEPLTRQMAQIAGAMSAADYLQAWDFLHRLSRAIVGQWAEVDVLMTPGLAQPPPPIGGLEPDEGKPPVQMLVKAAAFMPFTPPWNVTGQPAISLPLHESEEGLPIGIQLVGPPSGEELLLSLAAQLEEASPWADRRPEPL